MQETKWVDIARVGNWRSMNGANTQFTESNIDGLIANYDESERRIPLVFGHPKTEHPAYGWVSALRRVNEVLQAKFRQVHDDVVKLVEDGHFKNISISMSKDFELRHVGLLGAAQPAIPGLKEVSFANGDDELCIAFAAPDNESRVAELREELQAARAQLKAFLDDRDKDAEEQATQRRKDRMGRLIHDARALPSESEAILSFAASLGASEDTFQFASSDTPVAAEEAFWQFLEARNQHHLFETFDSKEAEDPAAEDDNPANLI